MRLRGGGSGRKKTDVTGGTMKVDLSRSSPLHPYANRIGNMATTCTVLLGMVEVRSVDVKKTHYNTL